MLTGRDVQPGFLDKSYTKFKISFAYKNTTNTEVDHWKQLRNMLFYNRFVEDRSAEILMKEIDVLANVIQTNPKMYTETVKAINSLRKIYLGSEFSDLEMEHRKDIAERFIEFSSRENKDLIGDLEKLSKGERRKA